MGCLFCRHEEPPVRSLMKHRGDILLEYDSTSGLEWFNQQLDTAVISSTSDAFDLSLAFRRKSDDFGLTLATLGSQLPSWASLRHLAVTFTKVQAAVHSEFFDTFFHNLSGCARLQSLTLAFLPDTAKVLEKLAASRGLARFVAEHKCLQGLHIVEKGGRFTEASPRLHLRTSFAHIVGRHRSLSALTFHNLSASGGRDDFLGHFLPYLSHRRHVTHLDLSGARGLSMQALATHVQNNASLVALAIRGLQMQDDELQAMDATSFFHGFAFHPTLRSLDIRNQSNRSLPRALSPLPGGKVSKQSNVPALVAVLPSTSITEVRTDRLPPREHRALTAACEANRTKTEGRPISRPRYASPLTTRKADFLAPHHPSESKGVPPEADAALEDLEGLECTVCMARRVAVRFHPCCHAVCCKPCAGLLARCPLCDQAITRQETGDFDHEYAPDEPCLMLTASENPQAIPSPDTFVTSAEPLVGGGCPPEEHPAASPLPRSPYRSLSLPHSPPRSPCPSPPLTPRAPALRVQRTNSPVKGPEDVASSSAAVGWDASLQMATLDEVGIMLEA